jgi:hypothetical protein
LGEDEAIQPVIALLRAEVGEREDRSRSDEESETSDETSISTEAKSEAKSDEEQDDDAELEELDAEEERNSTVTVRTTSG